MVQDTGGLRKIRVAARGKGKRGGGRVIYDYASSVEQIRLLLIYAKGWKDDLSEDEKRTLRQLNERW
ncbi:MAG TPA: type II toxin-antitoxin system RelE/ParE family toxin [Nevskiaceae bacterium]|nr:type II toxin-antitoxin system RelE/ParE family toxin [Nevskiaceae bacterium]